MKNTFVYYVTRAVHGMSISWSFGLYVNVIVRGLPSVYPHVMLTPGLPRFQRSPRLFQLLQSASRHAPAAYIGSLHQCQALVTKIRGKFIPPPTLLAISLQSLSRATGQPDWISIQKIDVPLQQHYLSRKIDEATFDFLLASAC